METNLFIKNRFKIKKIAKLMRIEEHAHELDWTDKEWNIFYDKLQFIADENKIKLERKRRFSEEKIFV